MIMILLGFYLSRIKWFDGDTSKLFSRLAMFVSIPLYMLWNMMKSYTKTDLMQLGFVVLVPAILPMAILRAVVDDALQDDRVPRPCCLLNRTLALGRQAAHTVAAWQKEVSP
jgi:predicted permease